MSDPGTAGGELPTRLAAGRTAEIYPWGEGKVLKLFMPDVSQAAVEQEARVSRAVWMSGLHVPGVGEIVTVQERYGLVLERVEGPSLLARLFRQPWSAFQVGHLMAELHAQIHATAANGFPGLSDRLEGRIQAQSVLPAPLRQAVLALLTHLPGGERICHGDFHPDNILMTGSGPVVIDWNDASSGNPLADVARTLLLVEIGEPPVSQLSSWLLTLVRRWVVFAYLRRYFQLRPEGADQLKRWRPVVAAARLEEHIDSETDLLVQRVLDGCKN